MENKSINNPGPDARNLGPRARKQFAPADFETTRPDGRYEFYPEPKLAVRMMMLVPNSAANEKAKVPAMVALPGSGASLESLAGEPDDYVCHFPARN